MSTSWRSRTPAFRIVTACSSASVSCGFGRVGEGVGAERRLDLLAHRRERRVGLGRDQRRDDVERPQERLGLERREPGGPAERVAVELLVDVNVAVLGGAVDGVAAAAEVDEVQQVEALLELLRREPEPAPGARPPRPAPRPRRRSGRAGRPGAPGGARTAPGATGPGMRGAAAARAPRPRPAAGAAGTARGSPRVGVDHGLQVGGHGLDDRVGLDGVRAPAQREDPRRERREVGVGRREAGRAVGQLLELAVGAVAALDEPGGVGAHLDDGRPGLVGRELPRRPVAVGGHVEVGRDAEVALAAGRELDLAADARDAERAPAVVVRRRGPCRRRRRTRCRSSPTGRTG